VGGGKLPPTKFTNMKQKKLNNYVLFSEYGIGYDSKSREFYFDVEDFDIIRNYTWVVSKDCVETKIPNNITLTMHSLVFGTKKGFVIDHKNHKIFDNRKSNLRYATKIQNGQNREKSKGWRYEKKKKRFSARIVVNKKEIHLGYFDSSIDARNAYVIARKKYFKEFAPTEE
jgi:hypothetical protein